jgi:hypothetical protein
MRVDTNTNGHRQWFHFSVRNLLPGPVRFNVYRFRKKFSLFQRGMRPYVFSAKSGGTWGINCYNVAYRIEKNGVETDSKNPSYFLTF